MSPAIKYIMINQSFYQTITSTYTHTTNEKEQQLENENDFFAHSQKQRNRKYIFTNNIKIHTKICW